VRHGGLLRLLIGVPATAGALLFALGPGLAFADPANPPSIFNPNSSATSAIAGLFWFFVIVAGLIFVGVEAALFFAIVKFRDRPGATPSDFHGSVRIEALWTAVPALILAVVFVLTIRTMAVTAPPAGDPLDVNVTGHQWWWEFDYPQEKIVTANELHVPVGETVVLHLTSADVIHSFWVPELVYKRDANPGFTNTTAFTPTTPGVFQGACSELCGVQHAGMRITVVVQSPADYAAWVKQQQTPPPAPTGLAAQGLQVYQSQPCANCHAANVAAGPDLSHVGSRMTLAAGILPNTPQDMSRWLANPQAVKPGTQMPNFHLTPQQVQALTAYLESLK
jgi:cytochrome c oxidase subunit 2